VGGGYIAITWFVGELFDIGEGIVEDVGDFAEGIGDALEGFLGAAEAADIDLGEIEIPDIGDFDSDIDADTDGPSPFSIRTIAMFLAGFGGGGLFGLHILRWPDLVSLIPATGVGLIMGTVMWATLSVVYRGVGSTSIRASDYLNVAGRVTVSIPQDKPGVVALVVRGHRKNVPARSEDGSPIPANAQVVIVGMEGGMCIVKKLK
jgi:hypothetical protein